MGRTNSSRRPWRRWGREGRDREALRLPGGPGVGAREGGRVLLAAPPFLYRALPRVPGPIRQSMSHWPFRSTPPRGRGDRGRCPQKGPRTHFDPRLRKEGDWRRAPRPGRSQSFDPRPLAEGATVVDAHLFEDGLISIHAPGGDMHLLPLRLRVPCEYGGCHRLHLPTSTQASMTCSAVRTGVFWLLGVSCVPPYSTRTPSSATPSTTNSPLSEANQTENGISLDTPYILSAVTRPMI